MVHLGLGPFFRKLQKVTQNQLLKQILDGKLWSRPLWKDKISENITILNRKEALAQFWKNAKYCIFLRTMKSI